MGTNQVITKTVGRGINYITVFLFDTLVTSKSKMEDSTLEYVILIISVLFGLFAVIKEMFFKPKIKYTGTGKKGVPIKSKTNWLYGIIMFVAFVLLVYFGNELRINHKNEKIQA